jgi:hypothetical protein
MILSARLFIEGHETEKDGIPLASCEYEFIQDVDQRGQPISKVRGGIIEMSFPSINDADLIQWMISAQSDKNGKIVFSSVESAKAFKTIAFKDARCFLYHEKFVADVEMTTTLRIS